VCVCVCVCSVCVWCVCVCVCVRMCACVCAKQEGQYGDQDSLVDYRVRHCLGVCVLEERLELAQRRRTVTLWLTAFLGATHVRHANTMTLEECMVKPHDGREEGNDGDVVDEHEC
jgi:hypothetical protein